MRVRVLLASQVQVYELLRGHLPLLCSSVYWCSARENKKRWHHTPWLLPKYSFQILGREETGTKQNVGAMLLKCVIFAQNLKNWVEIFRVTIGGLIGWLKSHVHQRGCLTRRIPKPIVAMIMSSVPSEGSQGSTLNNLMLLFLAKLVDTYSKANLGRLQYTVWI